VFEKNKIDYKNAGVNIDAGNDFVSAIKPLAKQTARLGTESAIGSFAGIFDLKALNYKDPLLVSGTDGVGTKLKIAQAVNKHGTIGQDLVAMCVNDILCLGAEPLFFLDYLATGKLQVQQAYDIVAGIASACKKVNCALLGGETAEMPGMYKSGEYDVAGFAVGIVERDQLLPQTNHIKAGDSIIGIASSGLHSNGFSLVRKLIDTYNVDLSAKPPFESDYATFADLLLEPTKLYVQAVLPLCKQRMIKGAAHITGGGITENLPRALPDGLAISINYSSWQPAPLFKWIQETANIDNGEMRRTFNMGIGMALIVDVQHKAAVMNHLHAQGERAYEIGMVIAQ
jgi:phosphoribosylaminoimidazole synthetase